MEETVRRARLFFEESVDWATSAIPMNPREGTTFFFFAYTYHENLMADTNPL